MLGPSNHNHPLLSHSRPLISEGGNKLTVLMKNVVLWWCYVRICAVLPSLKLHVGVIVSDTNLQVSSQDALLINNMPVL